MLIPPLLRPKRSGDRPDTDSKGEGGSSSRAEDELLRALVQTARWRGWRGGHLVVRPGLSGWFWVARRIPLHDGLTLVDLARLRGVDDSQACLYLSEALQIPVTRVSAAIGIKTIYGPHHNEVMSRLRRASDWATVSVDTVTADACLREHLRRLSVEDAGIPSRVVWEYPPLQDSGLAENRMAALYDGCLARRLRQLRAWGAGRRTALILADADIPARSTVGARTGTAWLWQRAISCFVHDVAWVGIGGDWSEGSTGNPFSSTRTLYSMGVSFYVEASRVCVYAADR